jgi:hypothetical protein
MLQNGAACTECGILTKSNAGGDNHGLKFTVQTLRNLFPSGEPDEI